MDGVEIYFDLDETLIHSQRIKQLALRMDHLFPLQPTALLRREALDQRVRGKMESDGKPKASITYRKITEEKVLATRMQELGWQEFEGAQLLLSHWRYLPRPGVKEFIETFRSEGRLHLCTAGGATYATQALFALGISSWIERRVAQEALIDGTGCPVHDHARIVLIDNLPSENPMIWYKLRHLGLDIDFEFSAAMDRFTNQKGPPPSIDMALIRRHHFHMPPFSIDDPDVPLSEIIGPLRDFLCQFKLSGE